MGKPAAATSAISTPPKLHYESLPPYCPSLDHVGAATPPLRPPGSVPFLWEEAPGKPKMISSATTTDTTTTSSSSGSSSGYSSSRSPASTGSTARRRPLFPPPPPGVRFDIDTATVLLAPPSSPTALVLDGPYHVLLPDSVGACLDGKPPTAAAARPGKSASFSGERSSGSSRWSGDLLTRGAGAVKRRRRSNRGLVWLFWRSSGDRRGGGGGGMQVKVVEGSSGFVSGRQSCCDGEVAGSLSVYLGEVLVDANGDADADGDGDGGEDGGDGGNVAGGVAADDDVVSCGGVGLEGEAGCGGAGGEINVRLTRWSKEKHARRSTRLFSGATSHLLGTIYGGLKHAAVSWRRCHAQPPTPAAASTGTGGGRGRKGNSDGVSGSTSRRRMTLQMFLI